jgi:alpha-1,3-glucanase-like protein
MYLPHPPGAGPRRRLRRWAAGIAGAVLVAALPVLATTLPAPAADPAAAGADLPFTEYQAADADTNGTVLKPDYTYGTLASEATGRQAVQLAGQGKYVSFTLTQPANAVDIHYAIPDSPDGTGLTASLSLYVDGSKAQSMTLTSAHSWLYGTYTFDNNPSDYGDPHQAVPHDFYDDARTMFDSTLPEGTVVTFQVDSGDDAPWYAINTADFENVPAAKPAPDGYLDVTQAPYNADNTGGTDVTQALQNAIDDAESAGTGVYLPQGTYKISAPLNVNKVSVAGAGQWYTELTGSHVEFSGQINPASSDVHVSDLAIFGNVDVRDDSDGTVTGFNGGFSDSTVSDVWIQNEKCGAWIVGPADDLTFENMRIQDTTADGVNFDGGVTNSTVRNSFLRNTGDDSLAMWSSPTADSGDTFTQNTVDSPDLANNIALYGGSDNSVTDNLLQDTVTRGGGIQVANRFGAVALSGTTTLSGNKLVRTGQFDGGWDYGVGAIWFYASDSDLTGTVDVSGNTIVDSPYEAYQFQSDSGAHAVSGVSISGDTVTGTGTYLFQDQTSGSVSVSDLTASGIGVRSVYDCSSGMTIDAGSGNSGWSTGDAGCGFPAAWTPWVEPSVLTFQDSSVQKVVVLNTGSSTATLGDITASDGFTVTTDGSKPCGTTLNATDPGDPAAWCEVDVAYTGSGTATGTLSIQTDQPGSPATVQLFAAP